MTSISIETDTSLLREKSITRVRRFKICQKNHPTTTKVIRSSTGFENGEKNDRGFQKVSVFEVNVKKDVPSSFTGLWDYIDLHNPLGCRQSWQNYDNCR